MKRFFRVQHVADSSCATASMAASTSLMKDYHSEEPITFRFRSLMVSVALVDGDRFLVLILRSKRRKTESSFVTMTTRAIFLVIIFFRCLLFFNDGLQKKTLTVPQSYCLGTLIGLHVQHLLKT